MKTTNLLWSTWLCVIGFSHLRTSPGAAAAAAAVDSALAVHFINEEQEQPQEEAPPENILPPTDANESKAQEEEEPSVPEDPTEEDESSQDSDIQVSEEQQRRRQLEEEPEEEEEEEEIDGEQFQHFIAHDETQTCSADEHARPFNNQIRGVNLGGWMVLEPWITPSLFYQFLSKDETSTAFDIYSFCKVLGPEEGNKQLRRHWDTWVTEEIIQELAESGAVNSLRLPVGDYMYKPYGPYPGCVDGALDYVDTLLDWAYSNGLSVLLDVHTMKDSQNGFDNSGQVKGFQWTSKLNTEPAGDVTFEHWPIRSAEWMGIFDMEKFTYPEINYDNIQHALDVIEAIVERYSGHPAVLGLEPLNEPWQYTPMDELKKFYWDGYKIVKRKAPYWKYILHDAFQFNTGVWTGFMDGCPDRALDTHIYQAWDDPHSRIFFYNDACAVKEQISAVERDFGPVVVGEWSLATDNCAMWLNGFNDNLPGFPRLPCKYIPCGDPYMGTDQPGTPLDPSKPLQGPYGTGMSGPIFGLCPVGRDWIKETSGDLQSGKDWIRAPPEAPKGLDDTDNVMSNLALKKINTFSGIGHGFYFWNFRTDIYDPQWSYMAALERGWIPRGSLRDDKVMNACHKEDNGDFQCVVKDGQLESSVRNGATYALNMKGGDGAYLGNLTGQALIDEVNPILDEYWSENRIKGATCDFGGIAYLVELNRTDTEEDEIIDDDDEYSSRAPYYSGPSTWMIILVVVAASALGGVIGFVIAMNVSKDFNQRVRASSVFSGLQSNPTVRQSLAFDKFEYDEISELNDNEHMVPTKA